MNKRIIIICVVVAVLAAGLGVGIAVSKNRSSKSETQTQTQTQTQAVEQSAGEADDSVASSGDVEAEKQPEQTEEIKVNPTFMYFVDNAQEAETAAMIDELKVAYPNVNFDVKNVEKNPEILDNFELVKGNIPTLIMLDTSNNICGFEFKCNDKAKLEASIKIALGE